MPTAAGTLELLARELAEILKVLERRFASGRAENLFAELGLRLPAGMSADPRLAGPLTSGATAASGLAPLIEQLTTAIDDDDTPRVIAAGAALVRTLRDVIQAIGRISAGLGTVGTDFAGLSPQDRAEIAAFSDALPRRLIDALILDTLAARAPNLLPGLELLGLVERASRAGDPANPLAPPFVRKSLHLDRVPDLLADPTRFLEDVYGWGTAGFDGLDLFRNVERFLDHFRFPFDLITAPGQPAILEAYLFALRVTTEGGSPGLMASLRFPATQDYEQTRPLVAPWTLAVSARARFAADVEAAIEPPLEVEIRPPTGGVSLDVTSRVTGEDPSGPIVLLSQTGGSRLEASRVSAAVGMRASSGSDGRARAEPLITAQIEGGRLVVDLSEGDGFMRGLLGGSGIEPTFDLAARWTPSAGLTLVGGAGLEVIVPSHLELGPVSLDALLLRLGIGTEVPLEVSLGVALTTKLGPLTAVVERVGARARFTFPPERDGNLGPVDMSFGFLPPRGLGLSLDAAGFKGGGFLSFDAENERYAGVLDLEFQDTVALKAIGLLTTRLPGGEGGFSLLILITAEFTPVQLGFGFTLDGVGGLLGLGRTARVERLRSGIRDNTLDSILFPTDVIENANRIISDLREVFPPERSRFVFGPMGKLGWGTPTLITLSAGLLIELPSPVRVVPLGVLRARVPTEELELLRLQVNFLGVVDFEQRTLAFDATLFDSRLLSYTLSGDLSLRVSWGGDPNLLLTAGGFHPAYDPPPLALPALRRMTVQLVSGDNPRLTLESYFAVTANTVQFGARVELLAKAGKFNAYGYLAFDALFQFNPFYFIAAVGAMLALRVGSRSIASIRLDLTLEGPTPWKAKGTAKLKLFWFLTVKVRFDRTFGEHRDTRLDPVEVLPLLTAALGASGNWQAEIPSRSHLLVALRQIDEPDRIVAHPFGVLSISQKVVPLNLAIDRFGSQEPSDARQFAITNVRAGGLGLRTSPVKEFFAPAQFFDRSDDEKLSGKSFERFDAGVRIAESEELESDHYARRAVDYELSYVDSQRNLFRWPFRFQPDLVAFNSWASKGAVAESPLSFARTGESAIAPGAVRVAQEGFAVVSVSGLEPVGGVAPSATESEARLRMRRLIESDPALAGEIQVVPQFEVSGG